MTSANLAPLNRTLDQELCALLRGASLECLVCGEFVMHVGGSPGHGPLACPECRSLLAEGHEIAAVPFSAGGLPSTMQAG